MKYLTSIAMIAVLTDFKPPAGNTLLSGDQNRIRHENDSISPSNENDSISPSKFLLKSGTTAASEYTPGTMRPFSGILTSLPVEEMFKATAASHATAGYTKKGRPVDVYYFPGQSDKRALVIGGVHGSELSAVDVANALLAQLQNETAYYSVVVVPCLFPGNAALAKNNPALIGSVNNIGRYTSDVSVDPNRQMPAPGQPFNINKPVDYLGRKIEMENKILLGLIHQFRPTRIVNIHAIRDEKALVFTPTRAPITLVMRWVFSRTALSLLTWQTIFT